MTRTPAPTPDLSVVIPVYERPLTLAGVLTALLPQVARLEGSLTCEVVVGDDGSTIDIEKAVGEVVDHPLLADVVWVRTPQNVGRAGIRNAAAAASSGRRLLFMDCDSYPLDGLLDLHGALCDDEGTVLVGRRLELGWESVARLVETGTAPDAESFEEDFRFSYLGFEKYLPNLADSPAPWLNSYTNNISLPGHLFRSIRGFDEEMRRWGHEDIEFGYRLHRAGGTFRFDARACVVHLPHGRSPIRDEADSVTNLEHVKRAHPTYETELLGLETYTNIERKIGYFERRLEDVRRRQDRLRSTDVIQELPWVAGRPALWFGCDVDLTPTPGTVVVDHGADGADGADDGGQVRVLGFWTPFADGEFDLVVNLDLWRFYPVSDLCLAIEEGLRLAPTVVLVESLPSGDHDDSWVMGSEYMHEALSSRGVEVSVVRTERLVAVRVNRAD
jgi:glycosyltransferase involved in cell wall biosynthesis